MTRSDLSSDLALTAQSGKDWLVTFNNSKTKLVTEVVEFSPIMIKVYTLKYVLCFGRLMDSNSSKTL